MVTGVILISSIQLSQFKFGIIEPVKGCNTMNFTETQIPSRRAKVKVQDLITAKHAIKCYPDK